MMVEQLEEGSRMTAQSPDQRDNKKPEIRSIDTESTKPHREKEVSTIDQSSNEPTVEKSIPRQRGAEVQNPLMHESY